MWRIRQGKFRQTDLSREAGLADHTVGRLERGQRPVLLEEIVRFCELLEVDLNAFLLDVQRRAFQPLAESLRLPEGASEEATRAVNLVSEQAEKLMSSVAELARRENG